MTDIKLFNLGRKCYRNMGSASALKKSLQELIEKNIETMPGIRLLRNEYSTGPQHRRRIECGLQSAA